MRFEIEIESNEEPEEATKIGLLQVDGGVVLTAKAPNGVVIWLAQIGVDGMLHRYDGCQSLSDFRLDVDGCVRVGSNAVRMDY